MILLLILICEISFWVLLLSGLFLRYGFRLKKVSTMVLALVPCVDLVLLIATIISLKGGAAAGPEHGLAALYIGFSIVFGPQTIRQIDAWAKRRSSGAPKTKKQLLRGAARTRYEWRIWRQIVLASGVSAVLLGAGALWLNDLHRSAGLFGWMLTLVKIDLIALIWPVSYALWPARQNVTIRQSFLAHQKSS
jgi:hypothetical protein